MWSGFSWIATIDINYHYMSENGVNAQNQGSVRIPTFFYEKV